MDYSDEEKHALELRRERSNKISKVMGEYLLKGYKMLGTTCNKCGTILMRDRMQNDYCVACNDIDGLVRANNAQAVVQEAVQESMFFVNQETNGNRNAAVTEFPRQSVPTDTDEYRCAMKEVEKTVLTKMQWACAQLQSSNLEDSFKVLELINACHQLLLKLQTPR